MPTSEKILDLKKLQATITNWQSEGDKVVFTNGCFDIIHLGHIDYLEKARNLGDRLIVALNTDASVSGLKGPSRPVVNEYARARVMSALEFVDAVTFFSENTPYELIKMLKPDILVKGSDYLADNIVGADVVIDNGGQVLTVELVEGYSTSSIINKIKSN
ncbi:MAG: D-glycero-beta-D-manno-heptose 1-phosphate adenylyltransferase [Bacteroidota bacterium]